MRYPTAILTALLLAPAIFTLAAPGEPLDLPWRQAGLTKAEAAAYLLDRFAFGARPGDVDRVVAMGLETWLARQLAGGLPDPRVDDALRGFHSLDLSTREVAATYPNPGMLLVEARREGILDGEDLERARDDDGRRMADPATRRRLLAYARGRGYRPLRELAAETTAQKLYRAVYSENQLTEVLTDFWLNHFNVSLTDHECRVYIPTYERDAIRPHVLGSFRDLLEATARHPAMLLYLDNARSVAAAGAPVTFDAANRRQRFGRRGRFQRPPEAGDEPDELRRLLEQNRPRGLNENYARELLELHTLGVDGGYSQDDVVAVARAFSGWTTYPPGRLREDVERRVREGQRRLARFGGAGRAGFVFADDFIFRADAHDAGAKTVLGHKLPAGRGIEDGLAVLDLLAAHPSTARHLAAKLAVRFVSDTPPESLVDRLATVYLDSGGDLRRVMVALAESPEFWSPEARRQKIKSPFELAVSALRVLDAEVVEPRATIEWISRMGQPLYAYQAPTGYPDRADFWVNTGALLTRMNFGLQLATGRVDGVRLDLAALNDHREPESLDAALATYVPLLLPERDPTPTIRRLEAVIRDPELGRKVEEAAPAAEGAEPAFEDWEEEGFLRRRTGPRREVDMSPLAQVVGVILGSPEFQRR